MVLDELTDRPDGPEVEVLVIDDEVTVEERADLHVSLDHAQEDSDVGRGVEVWEYLQRYRATRIVLLNEAHRRFEDRARPTV